MNSGSASADRLLIEARTAYQAGDLEAAANLFRSAAKAPGASAAVLLELTDAFWANFEFGDALDSMELAMSLDRDTVVGPE